MTTDGHKTCKFAGLSVEINYSFRHLSQGQFLADKKQKRKMVEGIKVPWRFPRKHCAGIANFKERQNNMF